MWIFGILVLIFTQNPNTANMDLDSGLVNVRITNISIGRFPFIFTTVRIDSLGSPIFSLTQRNFQIFENGKLQTDYFQVTPPKKGGGVRALDIVFVVDTTGSMEDEINTVQNHIIEFVDTLAHSNVDYRLGLVTFGDACRIYNNGNLISNPYLFQNWIANLVASGGGDELENQYEALRLATTMKFRPGVTKVIIMLTDAPPHEHDFVTSLTLSQVIKSLQKSYAVCYIAGPDLHEYREITRETDGQWFDIYQSLIGILHSISYSIASTYIIRYKTFDTTFTGQREVVVRVNYKGYTDDDTTHYIAGSAPKIILTDSTKDLIDNLTLVRGQEVRIAAYMVDHVPPGIQYAKLYYRQHGDSAYQVTVMTNERDSLYATIIPSTAVDTPGIEFYFESSDSINTVTLPSTNPHTNPFVISVWPNYAPYIYHIVPVSDSLIRAIVFDNTNKIEHVWLFFREYGTLLWDSLEMVPEENGTIFDLANDLKVNPQNVIESAVAKNLPLNDTSRASIYRGYIKLSLKKGVEYYIKAIDNWGIAGFHGFPDKPHFVQDLLYRYLPVFILHPNERFIPTSVEWFINNSEVVEYDIVAFSYGKTIARVVINPNPTAISIGEIANSASYLELHTPYLHPKPDSIRYNGPPTVYGRIVRNSLNKLVLQYWLFYPYNDYVLKFLPKQSIVGKGLGGGRAGARDGTVAGNTKVPVRPGYHEGDWELVEIVFKDSTGKEPEEAFFSVHDWMMGIQWDSIPKYQNTSRILVKVERGSHAMIADGFKIYEPVYNYYKERNELTPAKIFYWFRPTQTGNGDSIINPKVVDISNPKDCSWLYYQGHWGRKSDGFMSFDGPFGPVLHVVKWNSPGSYYEIADLGHGQKLYEVSETYLNFILASGAIMELVDSSGNRLSPYESGIPGGVYFTVNDTQVIMLKTNGFKGNLLLIGKDKGGEYHLSINKYDVVKQQSKNILYIQDSISPGDTNKIRIYVKKTVSGKVKCVAGNSTISLNGIMTINPYEFDPNKAQSKISFSIKTNENISVEIYDDSKTLIRTIVSNRPYPKGKYTVIWDGRNDRGEIVPDGNYFIIFKTSSGEHDIAQIIVKK